ncbi:MAG: apolipoprotein N-acyltransferase [Zetaproteobacteria bacterium]|nr:MAG: apolipoprotein N-acyltransferase [Zetaproteobacteria bacterium]
MPWAFSPTDFKLLALVALGGWAILLVRYATPFRLGWAFGLGWFGTGAWWLASTFETYGHVPAVLAWLCVILTGAVLALFPAVWAWASARTGRSRTEFALLFPLFGVCEEWLRGHLFTGLPWTALGNLLLDTPAAGWLSVVGVYGACILPLGLSSAFVFFRKKRMACLGTLAFWTGLALLSPSPATPDGPIRKVSLIQPNITQDQKWDARMLADQMSNLFELTRRSQPAETVVWPEASIPFFWEQSDAWRQRLHELASDVHGDLLVGGIRRLDSRQRAIQNGLFLLRKQASPFFVAKHHLVPFGEYVPSWLPWLHKLVPDIGDFTPGLDNGLLKGLHGNYGVLICYESIFPEEALQRVRAGADVLVVVTNDAWYGTSPAAWQHFQASRARAIETGRFVLRSANTGVSAVIAPDGHVQTTIPWWTRGFVQGTYRISHTRTYYVRYGDAWVLLMLAAGGMLMFIWRTRRL